MARESEWTPPSAWCSHPENWSADTADATEHEVSNLIAALVTALQPELVVETGSNTGQTSAAIGLALWQNGHGRLDTIEFDATLHQLAVLRTDGMPVNCIHGSSLDYEPPAPIDFGFFDSDAHIRHLEIGRLLPHFSQGALLAVHDTGPQHPVLTYLQPLINNGRLTALNLRTPRGVLIAQVAG